MGAAFEGTDLIKVVNRLQESESLPQSFSLVCLSPSRLDPSLPSLPLPIRKSTELISVWYE